MKNKYKIAKDIDSDGDGVADQSVDSDDGQLYSANLVQSDNVGKAPGNTTNVGKAPGNTTNVGKAPGNTTNVGKVPGNTTNVGTTTPSAVKEMQSEMQIFIGKVFPQFEQKKKSRYHSEYGIGDFLTSHYGSSYERFADPRQAQQAEAAEKIEQILDSMKSIGGKIAVTKPDGLWGQRTQLALKNIDNISSAILDFAQAIDFSDGSFTRSDRDELHANIPDSKNPLKDRLRDLSAKATKITEILKKLNTFTDNFQKHLTASYSGQFEEKETAGDEKKIQRFSKIEIAGAAPTTSLDSFEQSLLKNFKNKIIVNILDTNHRIPINLDDDMNSLIQKLETIGFNKSWIDQNFNKFIDGAKKQVIETLKANSLLMTEEKKNLIKEISNQLEISKKLVSDIISITGNENISGKQIVESQEQRFKNLCISDDENNIFNLKGLKDYLNQYNEKLKESLYKAKIVK